MEDHTSESDKTPRCPACGWMDVRRSMTHGILENLIRIVGVVPYRCRSCGQRFFRLQHDPAPRADE